MSNHDNILSQEGELAAKISAELMDDKRTNETAIEVINEQSIITLIGDVRSQEAKVAAEEIAKGHSDVISVVNSLNVVG